MMVASSGRASIAGEGVQFGRRQRMKENQQGACSVVVHDVSMFVDFQ